MRGGVKADHLGRKGDGEPGGRDVGDLADPAGSLRHAGPERAEIGAERAYRTDAGDQ